MLTFFQILLAGVTAMILHANLTLATGPSLYVAGLSPIILIFVLTASYAAVKKFMAGVPSRILFSDEQLTLMAIFTGIATLINVIAAHFNNFTAGGWMLFTSLAVAGSHIGCVIYNQFHHRAMLLFEEVHYASEEQRKQDKSELKKLRDENAALKKRIGELEILAEN